LHSSKILRASFWMTCGGGSYSLVEGAGLGAEPYPRIAAAGPGNGIVGDAELIVLTGEAAANPPGA
jgi:hypothetical protein